MTQKKINVKEKLNSDGEIDLSMSEIQEVPIKEIAALKKATTLNLYNNNIQKLPKNFSTLTQLVKLDLSKNSLRELPENFGDLIKLRHLDLYQNQLNNLPLSFSKLKSLKWLDLKENPLETTLTKVAGPCENTKQCQTCARNIVNYLTRQQNRADAEREEKAKRKKLQQSEAKKEEKKPKKIENSKQNNGNVQVMTKTDKKKLKKLKKQSEIKPSSGVSYIFLTLLLLLTVFVLTSINFVYLKGIQEIIVDSYFKLIALLPDNYQVYGNLIADYVKIAHLKTGQYVLFIVEFIQTNEQCQAFFEILKNITSNLWVKIHDLYHKYVQ